MRITKIENQKRKPGRKNIYADGRFLAGVSAETLLRLALRTGDELGPDQIEALKRTEELVSARNAALRFLATRPRSVREVRDKLREKEFSDIKITTVLADLTNSGLLNDEEFTRSYIRNARALKPSGDLLLKRNLLLLGVARETIETVLQETSAETSQEDDVRRAAQQFLRRAQKRGGQEPVTKLRTRLAAFLARRGFPWNAIEPAVNRLLCTREHETDEQSGL